MDLKELVINTIKETGTPMKAKEIAEKTGTDKKEIDKAIKALKKDEKIFSPKVCFYDVKG